MATPSLTVYAVGAQGKEGQASLKRPAGRIVVCSAGRQSSLGPRPVRQKASALGPQAWRAAAAQRAVEFMHVQQLWHATRNMYALQATRRRLQQLLTLCSRSLSRAAVVAYEQATHHAAFPQAAKGGRPGPYGVYGGRTKKQRIRVTNELFLRHPLSFVRGVPLLCAVGGRQWTATRGL